MKRIKEENPLEISSEISSLKDRYPDQETINQTFTAMSSTRKSNRIADTVKLSILKSWERYPVDQVESAIRTYLEKGYAAEGKWEAYLLGIIRNNGNMGKPSSLPHGSSTGQKVRPLSNDRALDDYYRSRGDILV